MNVLNYMLFTFLFFISLKHTDAVASLGVAGIADLQDVKNWIGKLFMTSNPMCGYKVTLF